MMPRSTRPSHAILVVLALAGGCASPDPTSDLGGDLASGAKFLKCMPGDTKSCGCLGSTVTGVKTCGDDGTWGMCDGCDIMEGRDMTLVQPGCPGCAGCCENGVCIDLATQTNDQCGANGSACQSCNGGTCDKATGTCMTMMAGCASSCAGCCTAAGGCVALSAMSYAVCGKGGAACGRCPTPGGLCDAGTCTDLIDPKLTYQLSFRVIDESQSQANTGETNPDPYACIEAKDAQGGIHKGCSGYCDTMAVCTLTRAKGLIRNQSNADYSPNTAPIEIPGSALKAGTVKLEAMDFDTAFNDVAGTGTLPPITNLQYGAPRTYGPFDTDGKVVVKYELLWSIAQMP